MEKNFYAEAPDAPGCYIFKNKFGEIIYVGKSKSLKKRLRQHLTSPEKKEGKYFWMYREISGAEIILTPTESDALILECELIKKYKPKYNAQLVYDAQFFYIKINLSEKYPSITITEETDIKETDTKETDTKETEDAGKDLRLGSFLSRNSAERAILDLNEIFLTPLCQNSFEKKRRACLNYHIKKCRGPCERLISESDYAKIVGAAVEYLKRYPNPNFKKDIVLFFKARNEKNHYIFLIKDGVPIIKTDNLPQFLKDVEAKNYKELRIPLNNLLEIGADKMFLELDKADKLIKEFNKFLGGNYELSNQLKKKGRGRRSVSSVKRARV
jgi:excinuclease ABC subunit C